MQNKKIIVSILITLLFFLGTSYAWLNFTENSEEKRFITGNIYLILENKTDSISLNNVYPVSIEEARKRNDNVVEFTISGVNTASDDIYYEILLNQGENEDNLEKFFDKDLRFDLIEIDENNNEIYLFEAAMFEEINNTKIWADTINANTNNEINKRYKLRMWLSDSVLISDTDPNRDYPATGENAFNNHYASIKIEVFGDFKRKEVNNLYQVVKRDVTNGYANEYTDITKDSLDGHGHQKVYYYNGDVRDNDTNSETYNETMNNVIFAGFCWQMVRTTDTGGVKLIYNGRPVDNKCMNDQFDASGKIKSGRENQLGIISNAKVSSNLADNYAYGTSYKIDYENKTFKLSGNIMNETWNSDVYTNLVGMYTCKNSNANYECETIYYVDSYVNNTNANVIPLTISETHYSQIGTSTYNVWGDSLSYAGYMYNKVYKYNRFRNISESVVANSFVYENGNYFLNLNVSDENKKTITDWNTEYNTINNTHYTCFNTTGECGNSIYYVFSATSNYIDVIVLQNGESINDAIEEMLHKSDVNKTNSIMKQFIDVWYENNLTNYTNYLDDVIYCNDRTLSTSGNNSYSNSGWNPNGGNIRIDIQFATANTRYKLMCDNITDSFSVSNSKAKLKYPVAVLTNDEAILSYRNRNINSGFLRTGNSHKLMSPAIFNSSQGGARIIQETGGVIGSGNYYNRGIEGVRPVITLKVTNFLEGGPGAESNPYIVG